MTHATPKATPPSGSLVIRVLKTRPQFLALNHGHRVAAGSFLLQARDRDDDDQATGIGFTCSKKVGNAVARNRAKRRLREAARLILPYYGRPGWDYALIGRRGRTAERDFKFLLDDLRWALTEIQR